MSPSLPRGLAQWAVAGGVELGEFVIDVDGDGADRRSRWMTADLLFEWAVPGPGRLWRWLHRRPHWWVVTRTLASSPLCWQRPVRAPGASCWSRGRRGSARRAC